MLNIKIEYSNDNVLTQSYKILVVDNSESLNSFESIKQDDSLLGNINNQKLYNINWDETVENGKIKCKVDNDNKVNVIVENSFHTDIQETTAFFDKCFTSFDNNDYPLIIIESLNGGGYKDLSNYLTNYINLNTISPIYTSFRYNEEFKNNIANSFAIREIKTCKIKKGSYAFESKAEEDDYGTDAFKVIHKRTQKFDSSIIDLEKFYEFRRNAKNIRKLHQIIIFTDGFSYSATSSFIKQTQLKGGAIIVGFGGNPNLDTFDASQSPSTVISTQDYKYDELSQNIENLGFTLRYTINEMFSDNDIRRNEHFLYNDKYPLEYLNWPIDERVNIYNSYDDSQYSNFISFSLKIFDKYKTECNPKNLNLLKRDCHSASFAKHMNGGYECGTDGKWSLNCIPSYCDLGYTFYSDGYSEKKCVKDVCYQRPRTLKIYLILTIIFLVLFILFGILGFKWKISFIITGVFFILFIIFLILYLVKKYY